MTRQRIHQLNNIALGICGSCGKRSIHPQSKCYCFTCLVRRRTAMREKNGHLPNRKTGIGRKAIARV